MFEIKFRLLSIENEFIFNFLGDNLFKYSKLFPVISITLLRRKLYIITVILIFIDIKIRHYYYPLLCFNHSLSFTASTSSKIPNF